MEVEERSVKVTEIIEAIENGSLTEVFGAGTAATIAQIQMIGYRGKKYQLPAIPSREFSNKVYHHLDAIKEGKEEDKFNWVVKI
jgi:branched-chain amino acid aminotransferase